MLRESGLSETVKKGIPREQCVFVARKRGNDELAPSDDLFHDFDERKKLLRRNTAKAAFRPIIRHFSTATTNADSKREF